MKRFNILFSLLGIGILFSPLGTSAQCSLNAVAEADVVLTGVNVAHTGISVGYNPNEELYYAGDGGGTYGNLVTFDATGVEVAAGIFCGYDFRGVWWNPNTNELEANSYSTVGIRRCDLDGSQYALNTGTIILPSGQPTVQSQGDYDWDSDEIIYYSSGNIYRYSHTTGALISSYPITGLPVASSNLSSETIGYTGCPGQEIVVYDIVNQAAYTIDKSTGAYVGTSDMPPGAFAPGAWYNVSYANGQIFIRSGTNWYGYRIFPACNSIDVVASSYVVCEGEEVTLDGTGSGTITWDGGVINGVPFEPGPAGTYTYTPTSDSPTDCSGSPVEITVIGLPTVIAGSGDLNYCIGEDIILSAAGDADVYIWNDGEPMDLNPPVGTYTYNLWGAYTEGGCLGENTDEVTVTVHDLPTVSATSTEDVICIGGYVYLNASGGLTYTWDNPEVEPGEPYFPEEIGTEVFTVTGTDYYGCTNTSSVEVEVVDLVTLSGIITNEMVGGDGEIDLIISGGAPTYTFDWDNDGTGDFDDTEDLTGLLPGTYTVIVESEAGCGSEATFTIDSELSINSSTLQNYSIYPNPTRGELYIDLEGDFDVTIHTIEGDLRYQSVGKDKFIVDLSEFAKGVYFVTLTSNNANVTHKIIKN